MKRKMTADEGRKALAGIELRHRGEVAEFVADFCVGRSVSEAAEDLGKSRRWIVDHLDRHGLETATGGVTRGTPLRGGFGNDSLKAQTQKMIQQFKPKVTVEEMDDEVLADGEDYEAFKPFLDKYLAHGHETAIAERLARAEFAAEAAIEAGVIKETTTKSKKRTTEILFPKQKETTFDLDLKMHMARVRSAAEFLDTANVRNLRRKSSCEAVAKADAVWREQVDLVLQHYQPPEKV